MKKKKLLLAFGVLLLILIITYIVFIEFVKKDNNGVPVIHLKTLEIFNQKNIKLVDGKNEHNTQQGEDAETKYIDTDCVDIAYGDTVYYATYREIDEIYVDKNKLLTEAQPSGDISRNVKVYEIMNISSKYIIAAEIQGDYHMFINYKCIHENLNEFINIVGPKNCLEVDCVKVELIENNKIASEYWYTENVEEWVWNTFLKENHTLVDSHGGIKNISDFEYPSDRGNVVVTIYNIYTGGKYKFEIMADGNVSVYDELSLGEHYYEYNFSESELIEALKKLVKDYEAYSVK